jgi:hypothetical protein
MAESAVPPHGMPEQPLQFSLRTMLILQAVCAVFFAMLVTIDIFAVLALLVGTLVFAMIPVRQAWLPGKRLLIDLLGGAVLPVLCFVYDPGFCSGKLQVTGYLFVGLQILSLLTWRILSPWIEKTGGLFSGILWAGACVAFMIGIAMLPFSCVGLLVYLIGALGFTPFLTGTVFARNAMAAFERASRRSGPWGVRCSLLLGLVAGIAVPLSLYAVMDWALGGRIGPVWDGHRWVEHIHLY